uniref:(northern house mosquito) hypothetical protein n=1 Tax=Culex pipiens TaxID=7175 RepID=A0A8D8BT08_CULPI
MFIKIRWNLGGATGPLPKNGVVVDVPSVVDPKSGNKNREAQMKMYEELLEKHSTKGRLNNPFFLFGRFHSSVVNSISIIRPRVFYAICADLDGSARWVVLFYTFMSLLRRRYSVRSIKMNLLLLFWGLRL